MCEQKKNGLVEKTYEQLFLLTTAAKIDQWWVGTNEKKKKSVVGKTYEQRFLLTSIEAFVFQKIKRRRRRRNWGIVWFIFFWSLNFRYSLLITHHSKIPYLFGTITHFSSLNIFHTICVVTRCSFFFFFFCTQTHRT